MSNHFTLAELVSRAAFTGNTEALADDFEAREGAFPRGNSIVPEEELLRKAAEFLKMEDPYIDAILSAARIVRADDRLTRLLWHCLGLLQKQAPPAGYPAPWPTPSPESDEGAANLWAIALLSELDALREKYRKIGIPEAVLVETLADIPIWMDHFRQTTGRLGFSNVNWLRNHFAARLFRLGRLQFAFEKFPFEYRVWHRAPSGVAVVDPSGARIPPEGGSPGSGARPFDPTGWKEVAQKGCPTLGIHIPASGPLDSVACGASIHAAFDFFSKYFPGYDYRAMTCVSWLLDPQLEKSLGPEANLTKFLREFYLFPVPGANDNQLWERVFGRRYERLEDAPTDNTLRRAVVAHIRAGGRWANGGGLIVPGGYRWGEGRYRG